MSQLIDNMEQQFRLLDLNLLKNKEILNEINLQKPETPKYDEEEYD